MPFQYKPRSQESYVARANFKDSESFDRMFDRDITMFKPHAGDNTIRILPPTWNNADHHGYDLYVHYGIGPDRSSYLSLWKHHGQPDPIDEACAQASRDGKDELERELRWTRRVAMWVIDRAEEDKGPQLWLSPAKSVDGEINMQSIDKQAGSTLPIDSPDEGYDVFFRKTGEKLTTKYEGVSVARRSTPLHVDPVVRERWLEYVSNNPIPSMLKFYSYERIQAVFRGEALSGGMEEVAPQTAPAAPPSPPAPISPTNAPDVPVGAQTAQTAPAAPPAPPAAISPTNAPPAPPTPPAPPVQPQAAAVPDLPPVPTRTRPTASNEEFGDVPY